MTSATTPKTIVLAGCGNRIERVAAAAIKPGMLVVVDAANKYIPHNASGNVAQPCFALEYDLTGRGIDDDYSIDDQVLAEVLPQGSWVYAVLAAGQTITKGESLSSNGDGRVKSAANTDFFVGTALEDVTTTGSPGRVKMEVFTGRDS
jgi:hypothetical protein